MQEKLAYNSFLAGGGECGEIIRSINWSETSLGPVSQWPQSLLIALSILLNSKSPMFLLWGPDFICFYNDAFRPSLGDDGKHPVAMGQRGVECWPEVWDFVHPTFDRIMSGGEGIWLEDQLLPIYRNGKMEDVYWTFSNSAVKNETGIPAGIFITVTETTEKVYAFNKMKENRTDLEFAIDAAELGTWDYNPETNQFSGNSRLRDWFGIPSDIELDLSMALNSIIPKDKDRVISAIQKALQKGTNNHYDVTYTILNPVTKIERVVRSRGEAFFKENGQAYRFKGTLQDITDDSIARRQLQASENNFKAMILQSPLPMCVLKGADYVVEIANEPICKLWGKTIGRILNKPLFEGLHEVKGQGWEELLDGVYTTGEVFVASERPVALPRNGLMELYYLNFVYAPFKIEGAIEGIIMVATDVTTQVLAMQKIQDAEERARLAMEAVEMGTYDLDFKTSVMVNSPRFNQIFGITPTNLHAEFVAAIHPDDREIRRVAHEAAMKTGRLHYTARIIRPDKSIRWIRAGGKVIYDENKNPLRLLGTIIDITESKLAEDELIGINQRLELALEAGKLGSYELNIETGDIQCNEQFKINFGLKNDFFTFNDLLNTVTDNFREKVRSAVAMAIRNKTSYSEEFQVVWPDDSIRWIRASGKVSYTDDGKPAIIIGVSFDITDHKNIQQQKDDFISIASHELKTPVTSIKAYTQVLERMLLKKGDVREAGMITKMDAQVNRLTSLIGDLLDVTKINAGKLQFNNRDFVLNDLVCEIVEDLQRTTEKHTLINDFGYAGTVYADRDRIAQVITNLITNAIKYSPQEGNIIISSSIQDNEMHFCVQDFGVGISEDKQARVFEQFYRVSGSKQHTFPGLGLGLYISSEIIKREGGRIWVTSEEEKGATFCFALPISQL